MEDLEIFILDLVVSVQEAKNLETQEEQDLMDQKEKLNLMVLVLEILVDLEDVSEDLVTNLGILVQILAGQLKEIRTLIMQIRRNDILS